MTTLVTTATSIHIKKPTLGSYDLVHSPPFYNYIWVLLVVLDFDVSNVDVVFYFQPTNDLSELHKVLLSVQPRTNDQYDIDLNTMQISHTEHGSCNIPVEGTNVAVELRKYANGLLKKVQNYRDRLIKCGVVTDSNPFLQVDLLTCPLCHGHLESCDDCNAVVACPNGNCPAAAATEGEWCADHPMTFCCHQCLDTKGLDATLVRCPTCQHWRYSISLDWCFGQIVSRTEELSNLPESDPQSVQRSHPLKPGPCRFCVEAGVASRGKYCYGHLGVCPSKPPPGPEQRNSTYCTKCAAGTRGRRCACGLVWTCDVCCEDEKCTMLLYIICPRCGRTFCRDCYGMCEYCQTCSTCQKPRLCDDCLEEEATPGEDQNSAATFVERCGRCSGPICDACSPRIFECPLCKGRVCGLCTDSAHCSDCGVLICVGCSKWQRQSQNMEPCPPKPCEVQDSVLTNQDEGTLMTN